MIEPRPTTATAAAFIEFRGVSKSYDGRHDVVRGLDCSVRKGEFLTFLGPSGSGKTTALMMLAGFEAPTAGDIVLNGRSLAGVPPHRRNMGVVFQNYALFPHMTVEQNVAFPLRARRIPAHSVRSRVADALSLVQLYGYEQRRPAELSGGQQQRVAIARALVFGPDLVLMDEPLGALDKQLREALQWQIKQIQQQLGVTVIYVTHDQSEALTLSDRIAVFEQGSIRQLAAPRQLYEHPDSAFVAQFIGQSNQLAGHIVALDGSVCAVRTSQGLLVRGRLAGPAAAGDSVILVIRPEKVWLGPVRGNAQRGPDTVNTFASRIDAIAFHGDHARIHATIEGGIAIVARVEVPPEGSIAVGDAEMLGWSAEHCSAYRQTAGTGATPATGDRL
jgi:putative spermidine/putrescine transport system ATP-binding protein